jgi:hypothetical protein
MILQESAMERVIGILYGFCKEPKTKLQKARPACSTLRARMESVYVLTPLEFKIPLRLLGSYGGKL